VRKPLVITDLTRMQHGRVCVAGYDADLHCIRPTLPPSGILEIGLCKDGNPIIFPAAEVECDFDRPAPDPPHTEDVPYIGASARFIRRLPEPEWHELLQTTISAHVQALFGQPIHAGPGHYVLAGQGSRSLGTIVPRAITGVAYKQRAENTWDYHLGFDDAHGAHYQLQVTDLAWRYFLDRRRVEGDAPQQIAADLAAQLQSRAVFLRIGLSRHWAAHPGKCFLQITGVHTFPDYLEGRTFADLAPRAIVSIIAKVPAADRAALRAQAETHLRALAGDEARLRDDQWVAIEALVADRRRALVVQRTGWGKSAVYFISTALLRAAGAGPTVIVSPLLALMRNQIAAAERAGIHAVTINSTNAEEWSETYARVTRGEIDVLLVSPERLNNPGFRDQVLPRLAATCGLLVVDEAHCISDWGHDFRPDFRRLRTLLTELPHGIPVLATTATANSRVVEDVAEVLGLGQENEDVLVLRGALDRQSLYLSVLRLPGQADRLAWLADHLADLPGSGIIYTLTVAASQDIADYLRERGFAVAAYSGQTDHDERVAAENDLIHNRVKALVATSALGMGFDKPDLGFVIHFGAPSSPVAYYQQVGRAGRGVERAEVILLPGQEDEAVWQYFASVGFPAESQVRAALSALEGETKPMSTQALQTRVDLAHTRLEVMLKVLDVDGAVRRVPSGWEATGQPWHYDAERYEKVAAVRRDEQQAMRDYIATTSCRMQFLREQLDDPYAERCGRCDNCRGTAIPTAIDEATVLAAHARLGRAGVTVEPRRQWPAAMKALDVPLTGKIAANRLAEPGRAIARFTDLGFGRRVREALDPQAADGPLPEELLRAAVKVLAAWGWEARPAAIVSVGSLARPLLVQSIAEGLARLGRLLYLGSVAHGGPPNRGRSNSAQRLRALYGTFALPADLKQALQGLEGKPILLVDDLTDSGWTLTLVTAMLREAGAGPVYPFVLGIAG
jgi:ATP-dependent DNA helicase RecQ